MIIMAKSSSIIIIDFQPKYNLMDIDSVEKKTMPTTDYRKTKQ